MLNLAIDEVGYGAWAGPVYICGVLFENYIKQFNQYTCLDSKRITKQQRNDLYSKICKEYDFKIFRAEVKDINRMGVRKATNKSIIDLIEYFKRKYQIDHIFIDGVVNPYKFVDVPEVSDNIQCIMRGDQIILEIGIASIIAKVSRDTHMEALHQQHPQYKWNTNVGYGTKHHAAQIKACGVTEHHRIYYKPIQHIIGDDH